jgi:hypothetical protein
MGVIPSNLDPRFITGSYSGSRWDPLYQLRGQAVGDAKIQSATQIDIAASKEQGYREMFDIGMREQVRSSKATEEINRSRNEDQIAMLMEQLGLEREELIFQQEKYKGDFALERERFAEFQETSDIEQEFERKRFTEFKETSDATQKRMALDYENLQAFYKELMPKYDEFFGLA